MVQEMTENQDMRALYIKCDRNLSSRTSSAQKSTACRLADQHALEQKYGKKIELAPLDDSQEKEANEYVYHRFVRG